MSQTCLSSYGLRSIRALMLMLSVALATSAATARGQSVPEYQGLVQDQAQLLPYASRVYLKYRLRQYEARTGHQLAFLSIDSLGGIAPEVYALKVAETWKLGRARPDDGLLLLVAKQERKMRIEVGYGLEGAVPDAVANRTIDEVLTPAFKRNQFAWGVLVALKALMLQAEAVKPEQGADALAAFLDIEAPTVKSYVNDHAQLLDGADSQRLSAKLSALAAESGMTFAVLTVRCPGQLPLEPCVDAVNAVWSAQLEYFDGLITWFVRAPTGSQALDASMESARLTLDRLPALAKQPWRKGATDQHAELESALRELVERAGLIWVVPPPPAPTPAVNWAPPMAAARVARPLTFEEKLTLGLFAMVLLGGLGLLYLMHRHSTPYQAPRSSERERERTESRGSSPEPYYGRGGGSWGSSGGGDTSSSDSSGGGGSFGGGGASGSW